MFRGTQILCSLALFGCITQHSGSSLAPNETDDTSAAQLPGVPNASPLQIPNPSPVLHSNNSTKASDSWAGLRPPVAISKTITLTGEYMIPTKLLPTYIFPSSCSTISSAPLNPDAVAKQIAVDRVNIPERPVHVQGAGAYGTFTVTTNFAQSHTMMDLFSNVGQTTPVTVRFSNALGTWSYVKLTFETQQGVLNFTEAEQAQVKDPGYAARELYSSIESGKFPRWKLYAQVMSAKEAENFKYNVLDSTSRKASVYTGEFRPRMGSKSRSNFANEMAIYADSSRYRLHQNSDPVKIAKRDLLNTQMPNGNGPPPQILKNSAQVLSNPSPKQIPGGPITDAAPKYDYEHSLWINNALKSMDVISPIDFEQPAMFYGNLTQSEKLELIHNIAGGLSLISSSDIRTNFINWLAKASADLSEQVAKKLKSMTA
ncbi:hypothetical protein KEM48_005875 [Puccinia striiformis f. sp. tritici PST-130]|nr:hypothetical protein KEM48_005875 [Puccinia striiformis f. sp. tritici PST-130]